MSFYPSLMASFLFYCFCPVSLFQPAPHEFYMSVCEVEHNAQTEALEIAIKLFTDDLEKALEQQGTERLHIGTEKESAKTNQYIYQYLQNAFTLTNHGDTLHFEYLDKEIEEDATWCYVEVLNVKKVDTITITNRLLIELFDSQINLVQVKANNQKKNSIFRKNHVTELFVFQPDEQVSDFGLQR